MRKAPAATEKKTPAVAEKKAAAQAEEKKSPSKPAPEAVPAEKPAVAKDGGDGRTRIIIIPLKWLEPASAEAAPMPEAGTEVARPAKSAGKPSPPGRARPADPKAAAAPGPAAKSGIGETTLPPDQGRPPVTGEHAAPPPPASGSGHVSAPAPLAPLPVKEAPAASQKK